MGKRRVREPIDQDDDVMAGSGSRHYGSTPEDFNDLEEVKGDAASANNMRQMNARDLIARKAEFNRANDPTEGLEGVDDGVADDDLEILFTLRFVQHLGIVETAQLRIQTALKPTVRKNDCGSDNRSGERSATGFVNACDERHALLPNLALESKPVPMHCPRHIIFSIPT